MSCNIPIVSTKVGDVDWLFKSTKGCYIIKNDPYDCYLKLQQALKFSILEERTNGREKIESLKLDDTSVAKKIINLYCNVLNDL